ncbi:hypothetical protein ACI2KR_30040 [Pseudomonas luteola]
MSIEFEVFKGIVGHEKGWVESNLNYNALADAYNLNSISKSSLFVTDANGKERHFNMTGAAVALRNGHTLSFAELKDKKGLARDKDGRTIVLSIYNHNTSEIYYYDEAILNQAGLGDFKRFLFAGGFLGLCGFLAFITFSFVLSCISAGIVVGLVFNLHLKHKSRIKSVKERILAEFKR